MPNFDTPRPILVTLESASATCESPPVSAPTPLLRSVRLTPPSPRTLAAAEQTRVEYADGRLLVKGPKGGTVTSRATVVTRSIFTSSSGGFKVHGEPESPRSIAPARSANATTPPALATSRSKRRDRRISPPGWRCRRGPCLRPCANLTGSGAVRSARWTAPRRSREPTAAPGSATPSRDLRVIAANGPSPSTTRTRASLPRPPMAM